MARVPLGEVLIEQKESVGTADGNNLPLIGVSNVTGLHLSRQKRLADVSRYKLLKKNWFAYNPMRINVGSIGYADADEKTGIISPDYVVFSCSEKIHPEYFFHFIKSNIGLSEIAKNTGGSVRERLYFHNLSKIEVELPDIIEQEKIVASLNKKKVLIDILVNESELLLQDLQYLRRCILQEAVQGKLTPQVETDEPASELLKRIKAEKGKLVKEGKLKKEKELPPVREEEIPFELPKGWVWCRLGKLVLKSEAGKSLVCDKRPAHGSEWGIIKVSAMSWGEFLKDENKVLPKGVEPVLEYKIEEGDYLISRANTSELIGKSVIVGDIGANLLLSDKSIRIKFSERVSKQYINLYNNSVYARKYYIQKATGTSDSMKNISREQMYMLPVPLPPLSEQNLIVSKVQSLVSHICQLEQQLANSQAQAQQLLQAVLKEAFEGGIKKYVVGEEFALAGEE